jgi:hypothetical protein
MDWATSWVIFFTNSSGHPAWAPEHFYFYFLAGKMGGQFRP